MAKTKEILVNGQLTPVTEFDHSAQEIDDAVGKVEGGPSALGALPLTGGVMTGAPYYGNKKKFISWHENDVGFIVTNTEGDAANSTWLLLGNSVGFDLSNAVWLARRVNGVETKYPVFHTGNKPSGTYAGNSTARTVSIGGIGNAVGIHSYYETQLFSLVTRYFSICFNPATNAITCNLGSTYANGVLTLAANDKANIQGATHVYQVL